jgi:hypothetical protein
MQHDIGNDQIFQNKLKTVAEGKLKDFNFTKTIGRIF